MMKDGYAERMNEGIGVDFRRRETDPRDAQQ